MRGVTQTLTGGGVAEGDEKEIRTLVMEDPAPSNTKFAEEINEARKTLEDSGVINITVRMVTRRLRADFPHRNDRGS